MLVVSVAVSFDLPRPLKPGDMKLGEIELAETELVQMMIVSRHHSAPPSSNACPPSLTVITGRVCFSTMTGVWSLEENTSLPDAVSTVASE